MARLTFHGATGTVTGSRFQLELDDKNILIDCGMFQGPKKFRLMNWEPFPVSPKTFDHVFLTHAHIDHSGFLPKFVQDGFNGSVVSTHATADLCDVMLRDSAHIHKEDAKWANKKGFSKHKPAKPLYTIEDTEKALSLFNPIHYGEWFKISENSRLKLHDSGHILGASLVDIKTTKNDQTRKILFSGDVGRGDIPVLNDPDQVYNVDYLILESTYGLRTHASSNPVEDFAEVINRSLQRGGSLVIPAFSVGRTQSLLYILRELEEKGSIPELPIFVDSPMAIETLKIFEDNIAAFDLTTRMQKVLGKNVFRPQKVKLCRTVLESKSINEHKNGVIIISASGMATAGRILHHLSHRLPNPYNTILLIGYQAEGTRGKQIQEHKEVVRIHGKDVPINAKIEFIDGFSGHVDYNEMLAWLMAFNRKPKKVFLVHGEPEASESLAKKIKNMYNWDVVIPKLGESFSLYM